MWLRSNKRALVSLGCWLALGLGAAAAPAVGRAFAAAAAQFVTGSFTVEDVDARGRSVALRDIDGDRMTMTVPMGVKGFDGLGKGDRIEVDFHRPVALSVTAEGSTAKAASSAGSPPASAARHDVAPAARAPAGPQTRSSTATVVLMDRQAGTMQVKLGDGSSPTLSLDDPGVRKQIQGLRPGDVIELKYTEATAADIRLTAH